MMTKTSWVAMSVALVAAFAIAKNAGSVPYNEALIRIQSTERLAPIEPALQDEPLETQVMLLNYSSDKVLLAKAAIALSKYRFQSRKLLTDYGSEPDFKDALRKYGEEIVPVIMYFVDNEVWTVTAMTIVTVGLRTLIDTLTSAWVAVTGGVPPPSQGGQELSPTATQRGWYAVQFIKRDGHFFLGQFSVNSSGIAKWNQTDRVWEALGNLLKGGISGLETKIDRDEDYGAPDVFFALVDVIPFVAATKLIRGGRIVTTSGKELSIPGRTRVLAPRWIPRSSLLSGLGKYGAIAATGYVLVRHPGLINSLIAELAAKLGIPAWLLQGGFWFALIFIVTYPVQWILKLLVRAALALWGTRARSPA